MNEWMNEWTNECMSEWIVSSDVEKCWKFERFYLDKIISNSFAANEFQRKVMFTFGRFWMLIPMQNLFFDHNSTDFKRSTRTIKWLTENCQSTPVTRPWRHMVYFWISMQHYFQFSTRLKWCKLILSLTVWLYMHKTSWLFEKLTRAN